MKHRHLLTLLITPLLFGCNSNNQTPPPDEGGETNPTPVEKNEFDSIVATLETHQYRKLTMNYEYKFYEDEVNQSDYNYSSTDIYEFQDGAWVLIQGESPAEDFNSTLTVAGRITDMEYYDLETLTSYRFEYFKDPLVLKLFATDYDDEDNNTTYTEDFCSFNEYGLCTLETMKYHTVNADESTYATTFMYQYIWED